MTIMIQSMVAGRHGIGSLAESFLLIHKYEAENWQRMKWTFETLNSTLSDSSHLIRLYLSTFSKKSHQLRIKPQIFEHMEAIILFQTTTISNFRSRGCHHLAFGWPDGWCCFFFLFFSPSFPLFLPPPLSIYSSHPYFLSISLFLLFLLSPLSSSLSFSSDLTSSLPLFLLLSFLSA